MSSANATSPDSKETSPGSTSNKKQAPGQRAAKETSAGSTGSKETGWLTGADVKDVKLYIVLTEGLLRGEDSYQYKEGLNQISVKFDPSIAGASLFATDEPECWLDMGTKIADVTVPIDAQVHKEKDSQNYTVDKLILSNIRPLRDVHQWLVQRCAAEWNEIESSNIAITQHVLHPVYAMVSDWDNFTARVRHIWKEVDEYNRLRQDRDRTRQKWIAINGWMDNLSSLVRLF